jgi:DNA polymerase sigma
MPRAARKKGLSLDAFLSKNVSNDTVNSTREEEEEVGEDDFDDDFENEDDEDDGEYYSDDDDDDDDENDENDRTEMPPRSTSTASNTTGNRQQRRAHLNTSSSTTTPTTPAQTNFSLTTPRNTSANKKEQQQTRRERNRRERDLEEEENNKALTTASRDVLEQTMKRVAKAKVERVQNERSGEMPAKRNMERLERALRMGVEAQKATAEDDEKRMRLLGKLEEMLKQKFDGVTIDPFGSFVSAFHTKNSDIDVSLTIAKTSQWYNREEEKQYAEAQSGAPRSKRDQRRAHRTKRVQLLAKFASELRWRKYDEVNLIAHARVPLVKFRDPETGIACDVCVHNDGVYKSAVLGFVADHDSRFRDLVLLIKLWAKHWEVNDAMLGTFNSYSLSLLALFTLQRHGICPPMASITLPSKDLVEKEMERIQTECEEILILEKPREVSRERKLADAQRDPNQVKPIADSYKNYGVEVKTTLAELFVDFFITLNAVQPMWQKGLVASTYAGRWMCGCSWPLRKPRIAVEDPFASGDNVARAVQRRTEALVFGKIRDAELAMRDILWAEDDYEFETAMLDMLGDPERSYEKDLNSFDNNFSNNNRGNNNMRGGGRNSRMNRNENRQRLPGSSIDNTLNRPPPPMPPLPIARPPPQPTMHTRQLWKDEPPPPPLGLLGGNVPYVNRGKISGSIQLQEQQQQQQQQQQQTSNLLAQMQSMSMNMNGHQVQQTQQQLTKSIAELEASMLQSRREAQMLQQQQQQQMSSGFGDELGGGIFSSIAKNTSSFGFASLSPPVRM